MQPITFTNGNRIFTPAAQSQQPLELTDLNGDGEIDILDAAIIASNQSNPGGIVIVNPPPPTIDDPFSTIDPVSEPQYCTDPGIITTGCNSVYNVDGTINWPPAPEDPLFCPNGKVRGFAYIAETNSIGYISECTCAEADSAVHAANILLAFIGPGKKSAKTAAKQALLRTIATAEDSLQNAIKYRSFLDRMLQATYEGGRALQKNIDYLLVIIKDAEDRLRDGISPTTGKAYSPADLQMFRNMIAQAYRKLDPLLDQQRRDIDTIGRINNEISKFDALIAKFQGIKDATKPLLDNLDKLDPETWIGIMMTGLVPIGQFFVPKFCGSGSELNETCECVPISSGSYSTSYTNNIKISSEYNLIESL